MGGVITQVDEKLALSLCCASVQCYNAFDKTQAGGSVIPGGLCNLFQSPTGLECVTYFTGVDHFSDDPLRTQVLFGLVFRWTQQPDRYVFAFRGTRGIQEWIDDAKISAEDFKPWNPQAQVSPGTRAEEGFGRIYYSMRDKLFGLLDELKPARVDITGHSLGGALAEIFTLDFVLSGPPVPFLTYTFAAPQPGNATFGGFYDSLTLAKNNPTVRVVNTKDVVPCVPPSVRGFQQVGEWYPICFEEKEGIVPNLELRHASSNYFLALQYSFSQSAATCQLSENDRQDVQFCTPDPARECDLLFGLFGLKY